MIKKLKHINQVRTLVILVKKMSKARMLMFGILGYIIVGMIFISLPFSHKVPIKFVDNIFSVVSAISTTGLLTVTVADNYTWFGQLVLMSLFQIGGWGFMTVTSFLFLVVKKEIKHKHVTMLNTSYSLPDNFNMKKFIRNTVVYTLTAEFIGAFLLSIFFTNVGVKNPIWSAIFHSVSAFATAGFSLNNDSFMSLATNIPINFVITILCYLGAMGFIVVHDIYNYFAEKRKITFTSKVIVLITFSVYVIGTILVYFTEPLIQNKSLLDRFLLASFQVANASTTAGFNSLDLGLFSRASLFVMIIAMIIGASPSGTGGGIKTTTLSALIGTTGSVLRKRETVVFFGHEIPLKRVFAAICSTFVYIFCLSVAMFLLFLTDGFEFEKTFFEVASALGTVGQSTGITSSLSHIGKWIIIITMYVGRVGPITIGLSLFRTAKEDVDSEKTDIVL